MRSLAHDEATVPQSTEASPRSLRAESSRQADPLAGAANRTANSPESTSSSARSGEPITGAEIVVRCLQEEDVRHVFGYPGGAVLYIYDAIFKQDYFQHILVRHEQAAVHAADAYSRSSHRVGVALVTSGPGVTNAVTGIATAYMDSIPLVIISGQVPTHAIGQMRSRSATPSASRAPA